MEDTPRIDLVCFLSSLDYLDLFWASNL
jgi:hypothetical protein